MPWARTASQSSVRDGVREARDRLPRDQLFARLQFAHLVAESRFAVPVEVYPSLAFDNLFENRGSLRNMSISTA